MTTESHSDDVPSRLAGNIAKAPRRHDNDHPLWQGPCAPGPLGGVTQSMLARFFSCRERFRLKYVCGLEPHDRWNHRLGYGNMWHVCEEVIAREPLSPSMPAWNAALDRHTYTCQQQYPMQRDEIQKWYRVCLVQFPEYVKYWSDHPDVKNRTPLMQEQVFDVPHQLPSGRVVRLRGKWDSVDLITDEVTGPRGGIYLQENKTKGDIDPMQVERQLKFDLQTMLYTVALVEGKRQYPGTEKQDWPVMGVRYNVVRRPLSGGKGNIKPHAAKYTKTKVTPAETNAEFYERLRRDYIADDPGYWFFRVRAEISAQDVEVFVHTCLDPLLEQVCWWYYTITQNPKELMFQGSKQLDFRKMFIHYRTPFGVYSALEEGGATEYDAYLATGSEAGLRRVEELFPELK